MELKLETLEKDRGWALRLSVGLDRRETSDLFLAGDKLISWPTEGMIPAEGAGPLDRSSMFLSEIVSRSDGLELVYATRDQVERVGQILAFQVRSAVEND